MSPPTLLDEMIPEPRRPRRRAAVAADRRGAQRERLPRLVRQAVLTRDRWTCQKCHCHPRRACYDAIHHGAGTRALHFGGTVPVSGLGPHILEIDHILPWSSGGADHPVNLRTLCGDCNQDRSNYYDPDRDRQVMPIAWNCLTCKPELEAVLRAVDLDLRVVFCMSCLGERTVPHLARFMVGGKIPAEGVPAASVLPA